MLKFFEYSLEDGLTLSKPEILLVKEFAALYEIKRNKEKGDAKGLKRYRAFREFTYIYLTKDWQSPYAEMSEYEKKEAAEEDVKSLPGGENFEIDEALQEALDKYEEMQNTRSLRLLNSAYRSLDELRMYFLTVDLNERDEQYGKPVYSAKDLSANIASLGKLLDSLEQLEDRVKKEMQKKSDLRGDAEEGLFD